MEKVSHIFLSLGSNIEERKNHLKKALLLIEEKVGRILNKSSIYETEAIGFISEISFYNMCVKVETYLSPLQLLSKTQEIEIEIGRKHKTSGFYESRKIDIDIILFNDLIFESDTLSIPHKNYLLRKFVLLPLEEISSTVVDPRNNSSIGVLVQKCLDDSYVKRTDLAL